MRAALVGVAVACCVTAVATTVYPTPQGWLVSIGIGIFAGLAAREILRSPVEP